MKSKKITVFKKIELCKMKVFKFVFLLAPMTLTKTADISEITILPLQYFQCLKKLKFMRINH